MTLRRILPVLAAVSALALTIATPAAQQLDRLRNLPGVDLFQKMQTLVSQGAPVVSGAIGAVNWAPDGKAFTYTNAGRAFRFDVATLKATDTGAAAGGAGAGRAKTGGYRRPTGTPPHRR